MANFDKSRQVKLAVEKGIKLGLYTSALLVEGSATRLAAVDTGRLRGSITHRINNYEALIGTNVEYAPYVELGTSRMAAQPYLEPALSNNKGNITKVLRNEIEKAIKGVLR